MTSPRDDIALRCCFQPAAVVVILMGRAVESRDKRKECVIWRMNGAWTLPSVKDVKGRSRWTIAHPGRYDLSGVLLGWGDVARAGELVLDDLSRGCLCGWDGMGWNEQAVVAWGQGKTGIGRRSGNGWGDCFRGWEGRYEDGRCFNSPMIIGSAMV